MTFDNDIPTSPLVSLLSRKQTNYLNQKLKEVNLSSGLYPLLATYHWGEFGKDVRIDDVAIRIENIDIAKEDFSFTM